jgi:hypothetical protein
LSAARHRITPPRIRNAAANYFLAFRQISGVCFVLLFTAFAWSLVRLPLPTAYSVVSGYGLGLVLFLPGALLATRGRTGGKAMLGSGAALLFMITVATLFDMAAIRLPLHPYGGIAVCVGMLLLFAMLAWRAASQSVSLLTLSLSLYMFYRVAPQLLPGVSGVLLFLGVVLLVLWLCLWTTYRTERLFTHFALFIGYGALYILGRYDGVQAGWLAAALVLLYSSMTGLVVDQVFRDPARHRSLMFFAAANTLLFALAASLLFAANYTGHLWFSMGTVFVISALAAIALYLVHDEGTLISLYIVAALFALLACILLPLAPGFRLVLLALACLVMALLSLWRNDRLLRLTEYALLATVFFTSFSLNAQADFVLVGLFSLPIRWAWLLSATAMLLLSARLHTLFPSKTDKERGGIAVEQELPAFACTFTASLLVTIHTILSRGDSEVLPVILSAQGMVFLGLGMLMLTPTISLAGLVPVVAGHTVYYAFPYLVASAAWTTPNTQKAHEYALIAATLVLAIAMDRWMHLRLGRQTTLKEKMLAAVPYLPALVLVMLAAVEIMPLPYLPAVLGLVAVTLFLLNKTGGWGMPGMTALGMATLALSVVIFVYSTAASSVPVFSLPWFLPLLGVYLICLLVLERLIALQYLQAMWSRSFLSYALILIIALVGAVGLYSWNSGGIYFPALLGLSLLLATFGRLFHVRGYYHVAILVVLFALGFLLLFGRVTSAVAVWL